MNDAIQELREDIKGLAKRIASLESRETVWNERWHRLSEQVYLLKSDQKETPAGEKEKCLKDLAHFGKLSQVASTIVAYVVSAVVNNDDLDTIHPALLSEIEQRVQLLIEEAGL